MRLGVAGREKEKATGAKERTHAAELGDGIEKDKEDFAAEVAKAVKGG